MVSVVEFLAPLGGKRVSRRDSVLGVMLYSLNISGQNRLSVKEIRQLLVKGRVPGATSMNIADALSKAVPLVGPEQDADGNLVWSFTSPGLKYITNLMVPDTAKKEIKHEAGTLEDLLKKIPDANVRDYVGESIECLRVGALRACVVFLLAGSIMTLQSLALGKGTTALNSAILKHDSKSRIVKTIDDFAYVRDSTLLLASQDLGIINKGEKKMLDAALDLRNSCGHPDKYVLGIKKVAAFVEDVSGIVFIRRTGP